MKRLLLLITLIFSINLAFSADITIQGVKYYTYGNNADVKGFTSEITENVIIPTEVVWDGINYEVIKIRSRAFENCSSLTSIKIPNSVTEIGSNAFKNCTALTSIEIPDRVTEICTSTFEGCSSITSVVIPNSVTFIWKNAFAGCSSLSYLSIIDGREELYFQDGNDNVFFNSSLKEIYLGRNLTGSLPFKSNINIEKITIGDKVTNIANNAFDSCSKLNELYICSDVKISPNTFNNRILHNAELIIYDNKELSLDIANSHWNQFSHVFFEEGSHRYIPICWNKELTCSTAFYSSVKGCLISADSKKATVSFHTEEKFSATFRGRDITDALISDNSFCFTPNNSWKSNLIAIIVHENTGNTRDIIVSEAGQLFNELGMNDILSIETLTISGDINGTDIMMINRMTSLKYLDLTNANIVEGGVSYHEKYNTKKNVFGNYFFRDLTNLTVICMPQSIKSIGSYAVNSGIYSIVLQNGLESIGGYAFYDCSFLSSIQIPEGVKSIGNSAFENCSSLLSIIIPETVSDIYSSAFKCCTSLLSAELSPNLTTIHESTFEGCISLGIIEIPNNISRIEGTTFKNCTSLTSINIPNSVTYLCKSSFEGCVSLESLSFIDGVELLEIENDWFYDLFWKCPLKELHLGRNLRLHNTKPYYYSEPYSPFNYQNKLCNITFGKAIAEIYNYAFRGCSAITSIDLPNFITRIGDSAFEECSSLTSINIPSSVKHIGNSTFKNCSSLTSAKLPDSLAVLSGSIFNGCISLSDINIPNNIYHIEEGALKYCKSLRELVIPESISKIGTSAFSGCSALKKVVSLNPTPPAIEGSTFDGVDKETCQLVVTKGNLVYYWLDPYWKEFVTISDDLLSLNQLPSVKYGDAPVNLAEYAPEGVILFYESSDNNVARIDGTMLTICGAGEATVSASVAVEGTPMEIIGQMRTFKVDKADLTITAQSYEINQGDPLPEFTAIYDGFVYDDNSESMQKSPTIVCSATDTSVEGVYDICVYDAEDPNYNINYVDGQLTIKAPAAIPSIYDKSNVSCIAHNGQILISGLGQSQGVVIYDVNGILCYEGKAHENGILTYRPNKPGVYIVKYGQYAAKVIVR